MAFAIPDLQVVPDADVVANGRSDVQPGVCAPRTCRSFPGGSRRRLLRRLGGGRRAKAVSPPGSVWDCLTVYEDEMGLVLSPTDLTKHLACGHLTTLDLQVLRGELGPPRHVDEALELIFRLGLEHEKAYLAKLRASSRAVVEIPESAELSARVQLTDDAVHAGADVVYQRRSWTTGTGVAPTSCSGWTVPACWALTPTTWPTPSSPAR